MKPARIIWVCWCLLWVVIWLGLTVQQLRANQTCAETAQLLGGQFVHCQSNGYVGLGAVAAILSGLAILIPVGKERKS